MIKVREHDLQNVVSALAAFEHSQNSSDNKFYRYLLCGHYLVPPGRALVGVRDFGRFLKKQRWSESCVKLPFRADTIQIKNNIRIFGYGPAGDSTAKIAISGIFRKRSLFREIHVRRIMDDAIRPSFGIPQILSYDKVGARWLVERQILNTNNKKQVAEEFILQHALGFYSATTSIRKIVQRPIRGVAAAEFMSFFTKEKKTFEKVSELSWPVALGHGDLSAGNMIRDTEGKLYLVDWETSGVMPVAYDLMHLYVRSPDLRETILEVIGNLGAQDTDVASPEMQMALALYTASVILDRDKEQMVRYFICVYNMDEEQANRHVLNLTDSNRRLASELLSG